MLTIDELTSRFPRSGLVDWIGIASQREGEIRVVSDAILHAGCGIEGEHHCKRGRQSRMRLFNPEPPADGEDGEPQTPAGAAAAGPKRQVTLIQREHLAVMASLLGRDCLPPELLRRNVVVSGINLIGLKNRRFQIGEAVLEGSGPCDPCSRMEEALGTGGYNAMRGHGGITARVIRGGLIRVGDRVTAIERGV